MKCLKSGVYFTIIAPVGLDRSHCKLLITCGYYAVKCCSRLQNISFGLPLINVMNWITCTLCIIHLMLLFYFLLHLFNCLLLPCDLFPCFQGYQAVPSQGVTGSN